MNRNLLSVLLIGIIILGLTGCGSSDGKKIIKYLESNDFKCTYSKEDGDKDGKTTCTKIDGIVTEEISVNDDENVFNSVVYTITSKNEYEIGLTNSMYYKNNFRSYYVKVKNLYDREYTCHYYPEYYDRLIYYDNAKPDKNGFYNSFKVGDNVKSDSCEYDFSKKVNEMLRKFEKYYQAAGVQLGK